MIEYRDTIDSFYDLKNKMSSAAKLDLEEIEKRGLEEELMDLLSEMTWYSLTALDDFIDYEMDYILDMLGVAQEYEDFMENINGNLEESEE